MHLVGIGCHGWLTDWPTSHRLRYDEVFFVKSGLPLAAPADHNAGDDAHTDDPDGHATGDDETLAMGREILSGESVTKGETTKYEDQKHAPSIVTKRVSSVLH